MKRMRWRIALTEPLLASGWFIARGLPEPSQVEFKGHTSKSPQSEGGVGRHGYLNVTLLWTKLTLSQANTLRDLYNDSVAQASGLLFMSILRMDGTNPGKDWIDVSGRPDLSDIVADAPIIGARGFMVSNITLKLGNVAIVNDPASF